MLKHWAHDAEHLGSGLCHDGPALHVSEFLTLILAQNKNELQYEVECWYWPNAKWWLVQKQMYNLATSM